MAHDVPVRRATRADLAALQRLEEATFDHDRISRRQWRRDLDSASVCVLVCGSPADLEAAAVVFYRRNARVARLYSLAVRVDRRGRGLATALLGAAERDARSRGCHALSLEVHTGNEAAIALYERHGYRRVARLQGFYGDGTDAWWCRKCLAPVQRGRPVTAPH